MKNVLQRGILVNTEQRAAYINDFQDAIGEADAYISDNAGHRPAPIFVCHERPSEAIGHHVKDLASYYPKLTASQLGNCLSPFFQKRRAPSAPYFSAYTIYTPEVVKLVEKTLVHTGISGNGDAALSEFWTILSAVLARFRVLAHKELFHGTALRTKDSIIKHRLLFAADQNELEGMRYIENQYAQLEPSERNDPLAVDMFWTLQLVCRARELRYTLPETYAYILG